MHGKVAPKTNISKRLYRKIVDDIEHDPLVKHSTLSAACLVAAIAVILGGLIWFARVNPGNLIQTNATVSSLSTGKTDAIGNITTFITFDFKTREGQSVSVRAPAGVGEKYSTGQDLRVGYHPANPNFALNLNDNKPPTASLLLWATPFALMLWFTLLALWRHHFRQLEIWAAAEAANAND